MYVLPSVQSGSVAKPASYPIGTVGCFPWRNLTAHLRLVSRSRAKFPLAQTSSWRGASLIEYRDKFTFTYRRGKTNWGTRLLASTYPTTQLTLMFLSGRPDWPWSPPSLLANGNRGLFPPGPSGWDMQPISHFHLL